MSNFACVNKAGSFANFVGEGLILGVLYLHNALKVSGFGFQVAIPVDTAHFLSHTARDLRPHASVGR